MSPNTHIIDMSKEALEDLNDALADEGISIEFGVSEGFAFYICHGGSGASTGRIRVDPFTKASECWKIARDLFPDPFPV